MLKQIDKLCLETRNLKTNALLFLPENQSPKHCAIFSHGYTSHKGSILTWAQKLMDIDIPCVIFDLPGHFLGSFNNVKRFEYFKNESHLLFDNAFRHVQQTFPGHKLSAIIGGHSLGALMSLKACQEFSYFNNSICVGLGRLEINEKHLFNAPLFEQTMVLRAELVSSSIHPKKVLPWISQLKNHIKLSNKTIYLLAGKDDLVVGGENGVLRMQEALSGNNVHIELVPKLPHHEPERAGIFIKKLVKNFFLRQSF